MVVQTHIHTFTTTCNNDCTLLIIHSLTHINYDSKTTIGVRILHVLSTHTLQRTCLLFDQYKEIHSPTCYMYKQCYKKQRFAYFIHTFLCGLAFLFEDTKKFDFLHTCTHPYTFSRVKTKCSHTCQERGIYKCTFTCHYAHSTSIRATKTSSSSNLIFLELGPLLSCS